MLGTAGAANSFMVADQYDQKIISDVPLEGYLEDNVVEQNTGGKIRDISKHSANLEYELKFTLYQKGCTLKKAMEIIRETAVYEKL